MASQNKCALFPACIMVVLAAYNVALLTTSEGATRPELLTTDPPFFKEASLKSRIMFDTHREANEPDLSPDKIIQSLSLFPVNESLFPVEEDRNMPTAPPTGAALTRSTRTPSGGILLCDDVKTMYSVWLVCYYNNSRNSRMCLQCERDEFWTQRWCKVDGDKLDCSKCPGPFNNHQQHHFRVKCEKPDKSECTGQRHPCEDGCAITKDNSYRCVCRASRRLNKDGRTCYDPLHVRLELQLLLREPGSIFANPALAWPDGKLRDAFIQSYVEQRLSLPEITEIDVQSENLREDVFTASLNLVLNKSANGQVASRFVNAIASMPGSASDDNSTTHLPLISVRINDREVSDRLDKCEVLSLLENCSVRYYCELVGGSATCIRRQRLSSIGLRNAFHTFVAISLVVVTSMSSFVALAVRLVVTNISETAGAADKDDDDDDDKEDAVDDKEDAVGDKEDSQMQRMNSSCVRRFYR